MAKVEMEDRAFSEPRLKQACAKYRVSRAEILGYASVLWRESQQAGAVTASESEILAWLDTDRYAKPKKAIKWLEAADLLRPRGEVDGESVYEISGNKRAVPRAKARIEKAVNAANARYNRDGSCNEHAKRMPYTITHIHNNTDIPPYIPPEGCEVVELHPAKDKPSPRDIATAAVAVAAAALRRQASSETSPDEPESEVAAFCQLAEQAGPEALKAFKTVFPTWRNFAASWYDNYKRNQHAHFEAQTARKLRPLIKVARVQGY